VKDNFYVYEHWRPDKCICFYVGKGTGKRAWNMRTRNVHHKRIQEKLKELGLVPEIRIILSNLSEVAAFEMEKKLLSSYEKNQLCNMTNGGEGFSEIVFSKEAIAKRVATRAGYCHSSETIKKMSLAKLGKPMTDQHKKNLSDALKGRKRSEESIQKQREKLLGRKRPFEHIEKMKLGRALAKEKREILHA